MPKYNIDSDLIIDYAKQGVLFYWITEKKLSIKISPSQPVQKTPNEVKRILNRAAEKFDELDTVMRAMRNDFTQTIANNEDLTPTEWELAVLWRLIDFSDIEGYLRENQVLSNDKISCGKFSEQDFANFSTHINKLAELFTENKVAHYMLYMESRV